MSRLFLRLAAASVLTACGGGDQGSDSDSETSSVPEAPLQYKPIVGYENFQFQGRPVVSYIPPEPVGVVWLFHGTNGNVSYCSTTETVATTNELILAGIGFICTQSIDQGPDNQWDLSTGANNNVDVQHLFALHEEIVATTDLEEDTPHFTLGFSNGGGMAGFFGSVLVDKGYDLRAVAPHSSAGNGWDLLERTVVYVLPENDDIGKSDAYAIGESRDGQGLRTEFYEPPELVLDASFFTTRAGLSQELADNAIAELVRLGLIDEQGVRLVDIEVAEDELTRFEQETTLNSPTLRTEDVRVAWAMHRMNSHYAREVRDVFLSEL